MRGANHLRRRGAFTLVELLVVITILGIMFALTAAAVVRVLGKGDEVKVRSELSQLTAAVKAFQQDMQVPYIPDRIVLREDGLYGTNPDPTLRQIELATQLYLSQIWPRLKPTTGTNYGQYHDWNGSRGNRENGFVELRGPQCLVFFLGGIPDAGIPVGFATDPTNPTALPANGARKGPYYEFPADRLKPLFAGNPFLAFVDVYGKAPYLYFSSAASGNDYSTAPSPLFTYQDDTGATVNANIQPFVIRAGASPRFANPSGFQIISAGRDTRFGVGGMTWAGGSGVGSNKEAGDDMANFHPTLLGIAGN